MKMMIASHKRLKTMVFETRIEPCRWKVLADVRPFCRKGLRSPAATSDQTSFDSKIMSPEITAPHFVVPCDCSCLFYESDVCNVMYVVNETIEKNTHMKAQMQTDAVSFVAADSTIATTEMTAITAVSAIATL